MKRILIKKITIILLFLLITAGLGIALYHYVTTPRQEGIAHLRSEKMELYSPLSAYSSPFAIYERNKPEGLLGLPKEISDIDNDVFFYSIPIGKNTIFVVIQKTSADQAMAWIDIDMDNDLADENALHSILRKSGKGRSLLVYFDFGNIQLNNRDFKSTPFKFTCHRRGGYINIQPINCKKGQIRLGNRVYQVAVIDGDYDGKFSTTYTPSDNYRYCYCDTYYIAPDHHFKLFQSNPDTSGRCAPLGRYYKKDERYYIIELSEDGKDLKMVPVTPAMGTLKVGSNRSLRTQLFSDSATQSVNFRDSIHLPAGQYQIHFGRVTYMHENGTGFESQANFCEDTRRGQFIINAGETTTLNPGPPFTIKSDIRKGDQKLYINAGLIGNEGERYGLRIKDNMAEPILKILDENETVIHSGQMEYG